MPTIGSDHTDKKVLLMDGGVEVGLPKGRGVEAEIEDGDDVLVGNLTKDFADAAYQIGDRTVFHVAPDRAFDSNLLIKQMHMPVTPKEGFATVEQFEQFIIDTNAILSADYGRYLARKDELRARDPEQSDKFVANIVTECADGRNSELQFMGAEELLGRFDHEWLPFAGNIIFPEFQGLKKPEDWATYMQQNPEMKEKFFERLDFIYGHKVEEAVAEYRQGSLSKINLEFQSHYDSHNDHHGCGAHKSNLLNAQLESIKDCLVADSWLAERYPEEYQSGLFRVVHTTHDTSEHGAVYRAEKVNATLPKEVQDVYEDLFFYAAQKFELPKVLDEDKGVVREYQGNPFEIETGEHDEQSVRISDLHYASTLQGQSVMEISWTDESATLAAHVKILLGIIERNFQARHEDKPAIVHFDLIKGNNKMNKVYEQVKSILDTDPEIIERRRAGLLSFVTTETDRRDYHMEIVK